MNFTLTPEQELFRKSAREFALKELEPIAADLDREHRVALDVLKKLGSLGYLGMTVPEEYGGIGADMLSYILVMEELSRSCASTSTAVTVQNSLCNTLLVEFGSETQKRKYLPELATGKKFGAFALTEPESGSDAAGMKTTAVPKGDSFILNGTKRFITSAGFADIFLVFALTDPSAGNRGVSCFLVERHTPGFTVGKEEDKMGIRGSSTCELFFENCRVPRENLIGELNRGFKVAMVTLDSGRIGVAAQALGIAQAALDEAIQYAKERKAFGKPLAEFQAIQFKLAEMKTKVEAARLLVYKAAWKKDHKLDYIMDASIAKLYASEIASEVADEAVQIFGGYGYIRDYKVERLYRDARITRIYEGTSEIQKLVIARELLKD
ncbi:MAG: acyl-CoA dehydrogenase [Candidatus Bipolaricaulota bacterium]|nr:acyl-CoA dehydrogenase [Candidatus Bipolaricaulota bacterium]MCS7274464.1 acyl-CoA dehydrogenase [Candidatus Bipolaricaulota bacterium]MDW8110893.1 acyl-CoA dehydrogenase [Candidatus Bipolaricaulota bacterium]MDW8329340.1 acyl-CoA dehydrogenase [Candidatus Bipolaricaulota bacterium]